MSWTDAMDRRCPFCGAELDVEPPDDDNPNVCAADCPSCGFHAIINAPDELRPEPFDPVIAVYRGGREGQIDQ